MISFVFPAMSLLLMAFFPSTTRVVEPRGAPAETNKAGPMEEELSSRAERAMVATVAAENFIFPGRAVVRGV